MPRFLLVAGISRDGRARPAWPNAGSPMVGQTAADGSWVSWRLTGANHRELGRAVMVYPDTVGALEAINELRAGLTSLEQVVVASPRDGRWSWRAHLAGTPIASSGRPYARHRECLYNIDAFLSAVPEAEVNEAFVRRRPEPPNLAAPVVDGPAVELVPRPSQPAGDELSPTDADASEYAG